jgi:very-short-patch-repair endonuclease
VSKFYPAVIYPASILSFLANNPISSQKHYAVNLKSSQIFNFSKRNTSFKLYQFLYFLLGFLVPISFGALSPWWLVALLWLSIGLGLVCALSPSPTQKLGNQSMNQIQTPVIKPKAVLRFPKHEAKLSSLLLNNVLQPTSKSNAPAGVSEKAFYRVLRRLFPSITQGMAFDNPEFSYPYSADFILVHDSNLSIDIEIDEPYVGDTKAPHHCIDQGKDDTRNKFFTSNNWVVIRFSEKQAVKYPYSCCKFIASVIACVAGDLTYLNQLANIADLPSEPMWTIKQAKKWAKTNYRKTYLPTYRK